MVLITCRFLLIICLYFTAANSEMWVWPKVYVDDGTSIIESTCGAFLKAGEELTWYTEKPKDRIVDRSAISAKHYGFMSLKFIWPLTLLSSGEQVYCVKSGPDRTRQYLDPIIFQKDSITHIPDYWGPWLTPETFVDDSGPVIEFTCWAYLYNNEWLSWYHIQASNITTKLATVQQEANHGYMKIKFRKIVEPSDNGAQIYCCKANTAGELKESRRISLIFKRKIEFLETPYVTVEPRADVVLYDEDEELEFVCGGSQPVGGRALTWHLQPPDHQQLTVPVQSYYKSRNLNYLTLTMQLALHRSKLYCAQDFTLTLKNIIIASDGERARSRMITLLHRGLSVSAAEPWMWPASMDFTSVDYGKSMVEATCGAYLKKSGTLWWYISHTWAAGQIPATHGDIGFTSLKIIWPLKLVISGEYATCVLRHEANTPEIKHFYRITFQQDKIAKNDSIQELAPWVTPQTFLDDGGPVIEFTCWAYLKRQELLIWYHIQGSNTTVKAMVQQIHVRGYMKITLRKTVEPSDNGAQIYCVKKNRTKVITETGHGSITLIFKRRIHNFDTPLVTVEPSADVVLYDEDEELEFVCSGSQPADGRVLTWHLQAPGFRQVIPAVQGYRRSMNLNRLSLTMQVAHHGSELYCAQEFTYTTFFKSWSYDERARSKMIKLLHRGIKGGSKHSDDILLRLVQLQHTKNGEWVVLTLNKTLEPSDNGSELYCAQQSVLPDGNFSEVLSETERIPLNFERDIPPLAKPFVTVEPDHAYARFDPNALLRFTCSGSAPVDGRNYTWFWKDSYSVLEDQKYTASTNLNVLEINANKTHHLKHLVCVQGFLAYIVYGNGSWYYKKYGKLAKSRIVTLLLHREHCAEPWVWPDSYVDDGNSIIESTCGAYLKAGENLIWRTVSEVPELRTITYISPQTDGFKSLKLILPLTLLSSGNKVYCVKRVPTQNGTNETRRDLHPITFQKDSIKHIPDEWGPWLTPETFVDDGGPVIKLTCWAYLYNTEWLSWYHIQGSNITTKLATVQQEAYYGYIKIKLRKTVEPSDIGAQIYCGKANDTAGELKESRRISLMFKRQIDILETPHVTVEPSADVVLYDEDEELEFVCGGSLPADGRVLTWHLQTPDQQQAIVPVQSYHKSVNLNRLSLTMAAAHHRSKLYCAQDFTYTSNRTVTSYGERARSTMMTLIHRGQCLPEDQQQVSPEKFVDDRKPFFQFTCFMFLQTGHILSWYQSKGLGSDGDILLRLVQLQDPRSKEGEWVVLTLNKTLEPSDNGSELYCAQQSVLPDGNFSEVLNETERIPLKFERYIPPLERPIVNVEPYNASIFFAVNTTLHLTCSGTRPVDGRNYTWFTIGLDSSVTVPEGQRYDASTNMNVLEMSLNASHHQSRLYCAQGFLSNIRQTDGSFRTHFYGERAKSDLMTLILLTKHDGPRIYPEHFVDCQPFILFTCYGFLERGQALFWYQSQGSDRSKATLLKMIQLDPRTEKGQLVSLILKKTFEPSDEGSQIYCVKRSMLPDNHHLESHRVSINFHIDIPPLELPYVNVNANSIVYFDVDATQPYLATYIRFTCSGSKPVDDRTYTWFRIDSDSNHVVPEEQKYNASTNLNVLDLFLKESYHQNQLFCAQGFLAHTRHTDGSLSSTSYGELARSHMITLILREKVEPQVTMWTVGLPLVLAALAAVLVKLAIAPPLVPHEHHEHNEPHEPHKPLEPPAPTAAGATCPYDTLLLGRVRADPCSDPCSDGVNRVADVLTTTGT